MGEKKIVVADLPGNKLRSFTYNYTWIQECNTNANQNERHFDYHYAMIDSLLRGAVLD